MTTKVVRFTDEDVVRFVFSKPDHHMVDFSQTGYGCCCGCLFVQIGKHYGLDFSYAERDKLVTKQLDTVCVFKKDYDYYFDTKAGKSNFSYMELKAFLRKSMFRDIVERLGF